MLTTAATTIPLLAAAILSLRIAWTDFLTWKISNRSVLFLTACFIVYAALGLALGEAARFRIDLASSLAAGFLLLVTGFLFWKLRLFGAGDAKLMFPIGLFVGWERLLPFAFGLAIFAVLALLALKLPLPLGLGMTRFGLRFDEIRQTGKVPYAVIIVASLLAILVQDAWVF